MKHYLINCDMYHDKDDLEFEVESLNRKVALEALGFCVMCNYRFKPIGFERFPVPNLGSLTLGFTHLAVENIHRHQEREIKASYRRMIRGLFGRLDNPLLKWKD